jgi:superfamily II DNA helicase RecQ
MRQIHNYQVIRYFPHILSNEFINVGVVLNSSKNLNRILTEEEAKALHCSAFIGEKKKFLGVIEYLNKLSTEKRLLESDHYFHNFRFGEKKQIASTKTESEVIDELFDDYIGFKIQNQDKLDERAIIIEQSV